MPETDPISVSRPAISRRDFLAASFVTSTAIAVGVSALPYSVPAAVVKQPGESDRGLRLGVASYSLRNFSLEDAIEITKKCGVRHLTLKDMHLPMKTSAEERREVAKK